MHAHLTALAAQHASTWQNQPMDARWWIFGGLIALVGAGLITRSKA